MKKAAQDSTLKGEFGPSHFSTIASIPTVTRKKSRRNQALQKALQPRFRV